MPYDRGSKLHGDHQGGMEEGLPSARHFDKLAKDLGRMIPKTPEPEQEGGEHFSPGLPKVGEVERLLDEIAKQHRRE